MTDDELISKVDLLVASASDTALATILADINTMLTTQKVAAISEAYKTSIANSSTSIHTAVS